MGKGGINGFVGRGQVTGSEAHDRSISPRALQFILCLSLPFRGSGVTWWPRGEWWVWSICLGPSEAAALALLGCLRDRNAFITAVPSGWATILGFFFLFYLFWRHQKNKYDVTGLKHILLTPSPISWPQESLVRWHPKNLFYFIYSSRDFWICKIYLLKINLQKIEFDKFFTTSPGVWSFLNQLWPVFCVMSYCLW